jgi:hypothetical protein
MASGYWLPKVINGVVVAHGTWVSTGGTSGGSTGGTHTATHHAATVHKAAAKTTGVTSAEAKYRAQLIKDYRTVYMDAFGSSYNTYASTAQAKKLMATAAANHWSLSAFQNYMMLYDKNYLKSDLAKTRIAEATQTLNQLFPGQNISSMNNLLTAYARNGNWNTQRLQQEVQGTSLFKQQYQYYKQSGLTDPTQYAAYRDAFRSTLKQNGVNPDVGMEELFFGSHITPTDFQNNWDTYKQGNPAYAWFTGAPLGEQQTTNMLFNQQGAQQTRNALQKAFQTQQTFEGSKQAGFGLGQENNTIVTKGI